MASGVGLGTHSRCLMEDTTAVHHPLINVTVGPNNKENIVERG
jgi:hypothetical protein